MSGKPGKCRIPVAAILGCLLTVTTCSCRGEGKARPSETLIPFTDATHSIEFRPDPDLSKKPIGFTFGVLRGPKDVRESGLRQLERIDWERNDVVFILAYYDLWSGVSREFCISRITRESDHILVEANIVANSTNLKGGPSWDFHAVLVPVLDLPVVLHVGGRPDLDKRLPLSPKHDMTAPRLSHLTAADKGKDVVIRGVIAGKIRKMTDATFWSEHWSLAGGLLVDYPDDAIWGGEEGFIRKGLHLDLRGSLREVPGHLGVESHALYAPYFVFVASDATPVADSSIPDTKLEGLAAGGLQMAPD